MVGMESKAVVVGVKRKTIRFNKDPGRPLVVPLERSKYK